MPAGGGDRLPGTVTLNMKIGAFSAAITMLAAGTSVTQAAPTTPGERPFRLCVVDQSLIVQQTRVAQNIGARFQQVRQQAQATLVEDKRNLDADARALDSLRASLPPAVARARDEEIAERRRQFVLREEQANRNLAALDGELTKNVAEISDPVIRAIAIERGCSMVAAKGTILQLIDVSLDLTNPVIERMNAASISNHTR